MLINKYHLTDIYILLSGWLYDGTGSYSIPFYFVGGLVIFSGVVLCFIPLYRRSKTRNLYDISGE